MSNFMQYLVNDIQKEIGDEPEFVYRKVEQPLALCLIRAAEMAGLKADFEWNSPEFRTMNIIVQQP